MSVVEHLPGEPQHKAPTHVLFTIRVLLRLGSLVVIAAVTWPLWIVYVLAAFIWGWPPNVPRCGQVMRYLRLTWTVRPPAPGLRKLSRCWITLSIIRKVLLTPVWGLAWILDEVLYGRALDARPLISPLIEISAGAVAAPNLLSTWSKIHALQHRTSCSLSFRIFGSGVGRRGRSAASSHLRKCDAGLKQNCRLSSWSGMKGIYSEPIPLTRYSTQGT